MEVILLIICLLCLLIATYTDFKWREVPDFISYTLLFSTIIIRVIYSITTKDISYLLYGIEGIALAFAIGALMYYTNQWGGADAKMLMGLFCALSTTQLMIGNLNLEYIKMGFNLFYLVNIFFIGAIYTIIYSIILTFTNFKKFKVEFKKQINKTKKYLNITILVILFSIIISFLITYAEIKFLLISIPIAILLTLLSYSYIKAVENGCFIKKYKVSQLREGDWVMDEIKINNKKIYSPSEPGITNEQIKQLKKSNKTYTVKEGIPFIPAFLIAFLTSYFLKVEIVNLFLQLVL